MLADGHAEFEQGLEFRGRWGMQRDGTAIENADTDLALPGDRRCHMRKASWKLEPSPRREVGCFACVNGGGNGVVMLG
jgi:hypothetical protein